VSQESRYHHQYTDVGQDYVLYEVSCETCGMVLFEFVHQQAHEHADWMWRLYGPYGPPRQAQSWYKPSVRVLHDPNNGHHSFVALETGNENKNQVVRSRPMTHYQFKEWGIK
jgi:hypothetical protein